MPTPPVQKNVPLDVEHHARLKRISILDETSMKNVVHKWIDNDGRGELQKEVPAEIEKDVDAGDT